MEEQLLSKQFGRTLCLKNCFHFGQLVSGAVGFHKYYFCCLQKVEEEIRQHWVHVKYADVEKATEKVTTGMCQIIHYIIKTPLQRKTARIYRCNVFIPPKDAPVC